MSPVQPASTPRLFSDPVGSADPEFSSVLRTTDPGPALDGPLTFLPGMGETTLDRQRTWSDWTNGYLLGTLAPSLLSTASLAARGCAREILSLDRALDISLEPAVRQRSTVAGRRLLVRLASSRGERWLGRFQTWVSTDEMPAHFPTVFAAQHALFHLPLRLLVPAYAYWEWTAAMSTRPCVGATPDFAFEANELRCLTPEISPSPFSSHAIENLPAIASEL